MLCAGEGEREGSGEKRGREEKGKEEGRAYESLDGRFYHGSDPVQRALERVLNHTRIVVVASASFTTRSISAPPSLPPPPKQR